MDIDVHHGDGVEAAFYDDPRVLTISLHEHPMTLFPGTGLPSETGGPAADGTAVNVALPAGTGDAGWLRAFDAVVPPLLRAVPPGDAGQPARLRHAPARPAGPPGADHRRAAGGPPRLHQLAHECAGGRWLLTGGGGYALVQVVPRTWTHLLAEAAGQPVDPASGHPWTWREYVLARAGVTAPERMTEGAPASFVPFEARLRPG